MRKSSLEKLRLELLKEKKVKPFPEWVQEHIYLGGQRFSFAGHKPLEQLYSDEHPDLVIRKAVQLGCSTYALLRTLWTAMELSGKSIYFGPNSDFFKRFTPDRVNTLINENPYIKSHVREIDNVHYKQIGPSSIYFLGLESKSSVDSVDADMLVIDEVDHVNQVNKSFAVDRLEHSSLGAMVQLSKPSLPGYGIDAEFECSDQRYWLMRCDCGHWSDVVDRFPECFGEKGGVVLVCEKCGATLDPERGEWVARHPEVEDRRGYHLSQLYFGFKPARYPSQAAKIFTNWQKAKTTLARKRVRESNIGLPYAGSDQRVTDEVLNRIHGPYMLFPVYKGASFLGADQGDIINVVIGHEMGERVEIHWAEETEDFARLDQLIDKHSVWNACIEINPNRHSAKAFAARHQGLVSLAEILDISDSFREKKIEKHQVEIPLLSVDREESIEETIDWLVEEKFMLPRRDAGEVVEDLRRHLKKLVKIEIETAKGQKKKQFKKQTENHYGFALNCLRLAVQLQRTRPAAIGLMPAGGSFYKGGNRGH